MIVFHMDLQKSEILGESIIWVNIFLESVSVKTVMAHNIILNQVWESGP